MASDNEPPLKSASWISRLFFLWISPLLSKGRKQKLAEKDLYELVDDDCANLLTNKLECAWRIEQAKGNPSLWMAIARAFGWQYMAIGCSLFVTEALKFALFVFVAMLVDSLKKMDESRAQIHVAYWCATAIAVCAFLSSLTKQIGYFGSFRIAMWLRIACSGLVYRKILRLNQEALMTTTTGQIVNLLSNELQRFDNFFLFMHYTWIFPLQFFVWIVLLWQQLGLVTLVGCAICVAVICFQFGMARVFSTLRKRTAKLTDERVKFMSEMINGIRLIKFLCWEDFFQSHVKRIRKLELRWFQRSLLTYLMIRTPFYWLSQTIMIVMLAIIHFYDEHSFIQVMKLSTLFLLLGILQIIRRILGVATPNLVMSGAETLVSFQRLQQFLLLPELEVRQKFGIKEVSDESPYYSSTHSAATTTEKTYLMKSQMSNKMIQNDDRNCGRVVNTTKFEKPGVIVENLSASWYQPKENKSILNGTLRNLTFSLSGNELVAIVGPVGAGKSSLLMTLLGELQPGSGRVEIKGKLGYVSQQSWVFGGTLRNNIIFGQPFEEDRYRKALHCAALSQDLAMLRSGDQTLVGERGVVLSGGQRARVSLARAIYQNADVYLLDDPLSAVDSKVGRFLFRRCIMGALAGKPRILVTHNMQFARQADQILVLQDGCITARGNYKKLMDMGIDFMRVVRDKDQVEVDNLKSSSKKNSEEELDSDSDDADSLPPLNDNFKEEQQAAEETCGRKNTWKTYYSYFLAGKYPLYNMLVIFMFCVTQALYFLPDWLLTRWSSQINYNKNASYMFNSSLTTYYPMYSETYFPVYSALLVGLIVTLFFREVLFTTMTKHVSQVLHNRMFSRLIGAPVLFYDTNPAGRVLSRCSKDIGVADYMLPQNLSDFLHNFFLVICSLLVAAIARFWVLIPLLPIILIFMFFLDYYLSSSKTIKTIETTTRSPIFSHVNNTLLGLTTVRAMRQESQFEAEFNHTFDRHSRANLVNFASARWLSLRCEILCSAFTTSLAFVSIFMHSDLDDALMGLSLIYSINLIDLFQFTIRIGIEMEIQMIAVERIMEYATLDQEQNLNLTVEQPEDWPSTGSLTFQNVSFRYSVEQPIVLHKINFEIISSEKIGIVGRTGSGKSSLLAALFRLAEIESDGGCIFVDGVSTRNLSLPTLRSKLSVIPQDPVLFSGTIRHNLDPFGKYDDTQIWRALEEVQMSKIVVDLNDGLDHHVVEGGQNFSVGQRQLFCFARALLGQNRILIIDEATANVDPHTEKLIQSTLRNQFAQCTVLTIAHRLHTVMDCDRLLVLDQGRVVQFDRPHRLLEMKSGYFFELVQSLK